MNNEQAPKHTPEQVESARKVGRTIGLVAFVLVFMWVMNMVHPFTGIHQDCTMTSTSVNGNYSSHYECH